jgi:hypothetical protein
MKRLGQIATALFVGLLLGLGLTIMVYGWVRANPGASVLGTFLGGLGGIAGGVVVEDSRKKSKPFGNGNGRTGPDPGATFSAIDAGITRIESAADQAGEAAAGAGNSATGLEAGAGAAQSAASRIRALKAKLIDPEEPEPGP